MAPKIKNIDQNTILFMLIHTYSSIFVVPSSIGHPPHSSSSPVELGLRVGPCALSGAKKELREQGVKNLVHQSVCNAPKENDLRVNK